MVSARLLPTLPAPHAASATAGMTKRYLTALGLVALLSTAAFISLYQTIATQDTAAAIVNYSGKRRYTSQRAALYATQLVAAPDAAARAAARREMLASIDTMEAAHLGLLRGNERLHLPGNPSPALAAIYFAGPQPLDGLVRQYIARVRALAAAPDALLVADNPDLASILAVAPGALLVALDNVVAAYQQESEQEIARLQETETWVFIATLVVLGFEALVIFRPMVRRVQEERAKLAHAEAYNRSILANSYDGIVTIDRHGDIVSANPAVEKMFALPAAEIVGRPFRQFLAPGDGGEVQEPWADPAAGVRTLTTRRRDGTTLTLDVAFSSMTLDADHLVVAALRESTEQLLRCVRDLERRNQELDQFAFVASHDLKAPLRAIANLATWIEEDARRGGGNPDPAHLDLLRGRVRRLESLIDGIHQYATATRPQHHWHEVDTGALVREICDEHNPEGRFAITIAAGLPQLVTDRTRLWQVLANLIGNAIKHHHRSAGEIVVSARDAGERWEFAVADDGPGIAPEYHDKIFVIFQTLVPKDVKESLGLGLALVKKLVREEGGEIALDSAEGRGATFRFTWPKVPREAPT